jgi:hypothetical protein
VRGRKAPIHAQEWVESPDADDSSTRKHFAKSAFNALSTRRRNYGATATPTRNAGCVTSAVS